LGNSTVVSTATVFTSLSLTSTTITESGSTVTVITTQNPSTATVTSSLKPTTTTILSQPTATPATIQGFDVFGFYDGDIMLVYESNGSIWTNQYQGSWNSPTLIASDAKPGTSVRLWGWVETGYDDSYDDYDYDDAPFAWGLTYVSKNHQSLNVLV
jgi:hypothetical protein